MVLAFKRIMIVTHNVQFAIDTKRALESLGDYEVTTVTDAVNVVDRLTNQAHNLILLDIENLLSPAPEVIATIRKIQNEIAIVLAPDVADAHDIAVTADVQGVVDIPLPVRQLIPILEQSVREIYDNLPETAKSPSIDVPQETVHIETLVDNLLGDDETPYFTSRQVRAQKRSLLDDKDNTTENLPNGLEVIIQSTSEGETVQYVPPKATEDYGDQSMRLFQKLAEEEPPIPSLNESGTISDLARGAASSESLSFIEGQNESETELHQPDTGDDDEPESIPAVLVLQTALNETTPIEAISLQTLYDNIQNHLPPDKQTVRPLPSWLKEGEKFIREPIFLDDSLSLLEYTSTTTEQANKSVVVSNSGELETEVIDLESRNSVDELEDVIDIDEIEPDGNSIKDVESESAEKEDTVVETESDSDDEIDLALDSHVSDETTGEKDSDGIDEARVETEPDSRELESDLDSHVDIKTESRSDEIEDSALETESDSAELELDIDSDASDANLVEESDTLDHEDSTVADSMSPNIQSDDPYDIQLAVTLTQVSTELTAEATILTRDNAIVAYSGDMPMEDIDDLRTVIADDWTATVDNARIRFITLPSSGKDFMLYSKGTVGGFTLSMIFAGTKQLRVIRRQGARLISALEATPDVNAPPEQAIVETETPAPEEIPDNELTSLTPQEVMNLESDADSAEIEVVDVGPKHPFTFIWLVDDIEIELSEEVAKKVVFWLEVQLNSLHWTIHTLDVHQDFIYLHADIPGDLSPATLIRDVMKRSTKIARSEDDRFPEKMWADAYLVLTPGREMTDREIQRFLNFARQEG